MCDCVKILTSFIKPKNKNKNWDIIWTPASKVKKNVSSSKMCHLPKFIMMNSSSCGNICSHSIEILLSILKRWLRLTKLSLVTAGKESACNAGDLGLIPGLARSPGEGRGYPPQYSGLENQTGLSDFHFLSNVTQILSSLINAITLCFWLLVWTSFILLSYFLAVSWVILLRF